MYIAELGTRAKKQKMLKGYHLMNNVYYMHAIEYYSIIKNKVLVRIHFLREESKYNDLYVI